MKAQKIILTLLALLFIPIAASAADAGYSVVIPRVLSYPTTTMTFSSRGLFFYSQPITPSSIHVNFDNPSWSATISDVQWLTKGGGTYITFACAASSTACMQATRGKGSYKYSLMPTTSVAPSTVGKFALTWDVVPPGDLVLDGVVVSAPEPSSLSMLLLGLVLLLGGAGLIAFLNSARSKAAQK
jgi:hypothetical protein